MPASALFALLGKDITKIDGFGPYLSLKLIAECGDDLSAWPSAKHFTSWLGLAPNNKISGGKSALVTNEAGPGAVRRRSCGLLPSPLGGPTPRSAPSTGGSRRASARPRRSPPRRARSQFCSTTPCVTAWNMSTRAHRSTRHDTARGWSNNLHRRAKTFGFVLQPIEPTTPAVPFLRNRSPASARRSSRAAASRRRRARQAPSRCRHRTHRRRRLRAAPSRS